MNKRKRLLTVLINGVLLSSLCMVASAADTHQVQEMALLMVQAVTHQK